MVTTLGVPNQPVALRKEAEATSAYQIGLAWSDGEYDGGSDILHYEVYLSD